MFSNATTKTVSALFLAVAVLLVAMAGAATAARLLTGKDIKNNSISGADIRNNSVKGKDLKDGNVKEADLDPAVKSKLNAPNVAGYEVVTAVTEVESDGQNTSFVACTAGKVAVGGGGTWENSDITDAVIEGSAPQKVIRGDALLFTDADPGFADGWKVDGKHNGLDPQDLTAYVICVDPS